MHCSSQLKTFLIFNAKRIKTFLKHRVAYTVLQVYCTSIHLHSIKPAIVFLLQCEVETKDLSVFIKTSTWLLLVGIGELHFISNH